MIPQSRPQKPMKYSFVILRRKDRSSLGGMGDLNTPPQGQELTTQCLECHCTSADSYTRIQSIATAYKIDT